LNGAVNGNVAGEIDVKVLLMIDLLRGNRRFRVARETILRKPLDVKEILGHALSSCLSFVMSFAAQRDRLMNRERGLCSDGTDRNLDFSRLRIEHDTGPVHHKEHNGELVGVIDRNRRRRRRPNLNEHPASVVRRIPPRRIADYWKHWHCDCPFV
jgi:hypothetical protein